MPSPTTIATTVVRMYRPMVRTPILLSLLMSCRSVMPLMRLATMRGTAISFRLLIKMVPKGLIQSLTNAPHP